MFTNPVINSVLKNEGGYVDHPNDTGGPTHWGITEKTARSYGYTGKMVDFTKEDAYLILEKITGISRVLTKSMPSHPCWRWNCVIPAPIWGRSSVSNGCNAG